MRILISNAIHDYKGACILFHKHPSTLLSFRKISGNEKYQRYLSFANYKNPEPEVLETVPTQRLPSIAIFFSDFNEDHEIDLEKYPIRMGAY